MRSPIDLAGIRRMVSHLAHLKSCLYRYGIVKATFHVRVVQSGATALDALHVGVNTVRHLTMWDVSMLRLGVLSFVGPKICAFLVLWTG